MTSISYRDIKGFSDLYIKYTNNYEKVASFYNGNPFDDSSFEKRLETISESEYNRDALFKILEKQNQNAGNEVQQQLNKINSKDCSVVITGQQIGMFWGPLYTMYKAITAVKLAAELEEKFNKPVIPVVWVEGEDHDFEEIRKFSIITPFGELRKIEYEDHDVPELISNNKRKITEQINTILDDLETTFGNSENSLEIIASLRSIYKPGKGLSECFVEFFREFFGHVPIVFLNPGDEHFKEISIPYFEKVINDREDIEKCLLESSEALLKSEFNPQVKIRENLIHLHISNEKGRRRMSLDDIPASHSPKDFTTSNYSKLSSDVLSRPIMQDYLLPTAAYIGGPGETAYMAQLRPFYEHMQVDMPIIFPRFSATILDERSVKTIEDTGMTRQDFVVRKENIIINDIFEKRQETDFDELFEPVFKGLNRSLADVKSFTENVNKSLVNMIDSSENKINFQIEKIKEKLISAVKNSDKNYLDKIKKVKTNISPGDKMQERELCLLNYLLRYGRAFPEKLTQRITTESNEHKIIEVKI